MSGDVATIAELGSWVRDFARRINEAREELTELDSAIGDADHGINMDRGMKAVIAKLDSDQAATAAELFKNVGMTLVSTVGGASGPLYGTFFLRFGMVGGDSVDLSAADFAKAMRAGLEGVVARGKAEPGDKTMFDALDPAVEALESALSGGAGLGDALAQAAQAAELGRDATIPLVARKGRASYLGERSAGHQDPGATSTAMLVRSAASVIG
ncbi:MAG TPA: dihydroxyacetone kinase subunit DhaL [Acidimicrobiia bacterium]|nr:dihydroxyacetone kinase subunit DhaL [Acidimicrobiia bacterium]